MSPIFCLKASILLIYANTHVEKFSIRENFSRVISVLVGKIMSEKKITHLFINRSIALSSIKS